VRKEAVADLCGLKSDPAFLNGGWSFGEVSSFAEWQIVLFQAVIDPLRADLREISPIIEPFRERRNPCPLRKRRAPSFFAASAGFAHALCACFKYEQL
jgi:hypothetical protein